MTRAPEPDDSRNSGVDGVVVNFPYNTTDPIRPRPQDPVPATDVVEVVDAEIVDEADDKSSAVPVDTAVVDSGSWLDHLRSQQRQPVIPAYLKSVHDAVDAAKWVGKHYAHKAGYHAVRSPLYGLRLTVRAPLGLFVLAAATGRYVFDAEGAVARSRTATSDQAELYLKLSQQRDRRVVLRMVQFGLVATVGVVLLMVLPNLLPQWVIWACGVVAVGILGKIGTPRDKPVIGGRAVLDTKVAKLTSDAVVHALSVLGVAGINQALTKDPNAIEFKAPITRDGPGWRAELDLPRGVTVTDVIERRAKLASGLTRPLGCVWPDGNAEVHPGRLVLWVGDQDMSKAQQPAWPLRKPGASVDLFKALPFGTDQRGRWVEITLMFVSMVIGAVPRMGKTFTLRQLLVMAALDPRVELHPYDLKGTGDLSPLAPVAHRYRAGDDPEDIEYAIADLRGLRDELRRRAKVIRELPKDMCPENKVTPDLASKKSLGLHPIVIGVDECQVWFEHKEYGAEFEEICTDLVKRGPALGMILILATQRPDAKSIPTGIAANAIMRYCLKVAGQVENDMVLGTSSYKNGIRATTLSFRDKGIGYLKGEGDEPQITRGVYIDALEAEKLIAGARAKRLAAGRLSGYAAGLDLDPEESGDNSTLLADVLTAIGDADKAWSESIVDRLADLRPDTYGPWGELPTGTAKATHLANALKPYGITTKQVWGTDPDSGKGANRMGVKREWIADCLTERDERGRRG